MRRIEDAVESHLDGAVGKDGLPDLKRVRVRVRTNPKEAGTGSILTSENMGF